MEKKGGVISLEYMIDNQQLLGCRNFTIRPIAIIIGVCRIFELVCDDGETVIATITPKQMNSDYPMSFCKRLDAIYFETDVLCRWDGDKDMLVELKKQLYALPMEEIGKYDWER